MAGIGGMINRSKTMNHSTLTDEQLRERRLRNADKEDKRYSIDPARRAAIAADRARLIAILEASQ